MLGHRVTWLLACWFFVAATPAGRVHGAEAARPHVVIILADDMGYGDPGCYNPASRIPTPHIDRLALEGMRFTDAHAAGPLCHMSRYGLMTGRYPFRTEVDSWRTRPLIDDGQVTVASLARAQGYRTAMVGKWHLGFAERGYDQPLSGGPADRGFDFFFGIRASTDIPPYFYIRDDRAVTPPTDTIAENHSDGWSPIQGAFWRGGGIAPDLKLEEVLPRFSDEAVAVIRGHAAGGASQPLLLYLAYPAPHTPWLPGKEFRGRSGAGLYGDFVVMVDTMIGRVLAELDRSGMAGNTLVVFTSDNGPTWYPHDTERFGHDSAGGLRGMKGDAWEAGHRVPLIVRWPAHVPAAAVSHETIGFTDVLATLAELWGASLPSGAGPDSVSFLSALRGESVRDQPIRECLVLETANGTQTIRAGDLKLINALGSGGFTKPSRIEPGPGDPPGQLYNLAEDPGERRNLYAERPDVVARLQAMLAAELDP